MQIRPTCEIDDCNRKAHWNGQYRADGSRAYRKYCGHHHKERGKRFNELRARTDRRSSPKCAAVGCNKRTTLNGTDINGSPLYTTYCTEHLNLSTVYLGFRKDHCENIDGRLGFICTTNIFWAGMLDVDHINGNPHDNREENLQTLCKCCHSYKGWANKDYATPGRKALKTVDIVA